MDYISYNKEGLHFGHALDFTHHNDYMIHCHNSYEVYYFISGDVSYLVEGKHYTPTPHSILMISPNILHGVKVKTDSAYERYTLHFSSQIIPAENRLLLLFPFHQTTSQSDIYYQDVEDFRLQHYFENLSACKDMPGEMRDMAIAIAVQSLLSQILYMSKQTKSLATPEHISQTVTKIIHYINNHLTERITLDAISSRFFISKHHLNKVFRKATGTTLVQYINYKRIAMANQYIMQGKSAMDAALSVGFHDYSVFYRAYKRILGHAPTAKAIKRCSKG